MPFSRTELEQQIRDLSKIRWHMSETLLFEIKPEMVEAALSVLAALPDDRLPSSVSFNFPYGGVIMMWGSRKRLPYLVTICAEDYYTPNEESVREISLEEFRRNYPGPDMRR